MKNELKAIKALPWVESAELSKECVRYNTREVILVTAKEGALTMKLSWLLRGTRWYRTQRNLRVILPQYQLAVYKDPVWKTYNVYMRMAKKPTIADGLGSALTFHSSFQYYAPEHLASLFVEPCTGSWQGSIEQAKSAAEALQAFAFYLQSSRPDRSGTIRRSTWAQTLGLKLSEKTRARIIKSRKKLEATNV